MQNTIFGITKKTHIRYVIMCGTDIKYRKNSFKVFYLKTFSAVICYYKMSCNNIPLNPNSAVVRIFTPGP